MDRPEHSSGDAGSDDRLKKATSRMGTTIMQKTGQVERTVDREFAEEEGRYRVYVVCSASTRIATTPLARSR